MSFFHSVEALSILHKLSSENLIIAPLLELKDIRKATESILFL